MRKFLMPIAGMVLLGTVSSVSVLASKPIQENEGLLEIEDEKVVKAELAAANKSELVPAPSSRSGSAVGDKPIFPMSILSTYYVFRKKSGGGIIRRQVVDYIKYPKSETDFIYYGERVYWISRNSRGEGCKIKTNGLSLSKSDLPKDYKAEIVVKNLKNEQTGGIEFSHTRFYAPPKMFKLPKLPPLIMRVVSTTVTPDNATQPSRTFTVRLKAP